MYHCYFLINYIGPPKVFSFPLAPSLKSLPITALGSARALGENQRKEQIFVKMGHGVGGEPPTPQE